MNGFLKTEELLKEKLSKLQDKLLDLSKRNKMINSNFQSRSKTHFRIIDEIPDFLYHKLSKGNMEFKSLPPLDENPEDENTSEFKERLAIKEKEDEEYIKEMERIETEQTDNLNEAHEIALRKLKDKIRDELGLPPVSTKHTPIEEHCKKQGLNPNYDLPILNSNAKNNQNWIDKKIQTLMLPDTLTQYIDSIYRKYRSTLKERGINILHFCFGFLEWRESSSSNQKLYAPIITFQVFLEQKRNKKYVNGVGSELKINDSLKEKLKRDFNFTLPELKEKENNLKTDSIIHEYLQEVEKEITKNNRNWKLKNWVSFGLYNTQNMSIHKDIVDMKKGILSNNRNSKLEKILLGHSIGSRESEEYDVDSKECRKVSPVLIESADASQHSAVIDVLRARDIVIKGPPGTGKSQTITNIISSLISKGKKVLFVAQKQAALDVVRNKLQSNGLDNYILEVFSAKANKKLIMESIKRRLRLDLRNGESDVSKQLDQTRRELENTKDKLNKYAQFMAKRFENTDFTIHEIIWHYKPLENLQFFPINNVQTLSKNSIKDNISILSDIKSLYPQGLSSLKENPLRKIKKLPYISDDFYSIEQKISSFYEETKSLLKEKESILKVNNSLKNMDEAIFNHPLIKEWIALDKEKEHIVRYYLNLLRIAFYTDLKDLKIYFQSEKEYNKIKNTNISQEQSISSICKLENLPDLPCIKNTSLILERESISCVFSEEWQRAKQIFQNLYIGQEKIISIKEIKIVLHNEQKIFLESNNSLIQKIIKYTDSENLKTYIKEKKKYIEVKRRNEEYENRISSVCKMENLPEIFLIEKASQALEKSNIFFIFLPEYRKAQKIFTQIYIGKKNLYSKHSILKQLCSYLKSKPFDKQREAECKKQTDDLYQTLQNVISAETTKYTASVILNELYGYLERRPINKQREVECKKQTDDLYQTLYNKVQIENLDTVLAETTDNIILKMAEDSKLFSSEFKDSWLNNPDSLIQYNNLIIKERALIEKCHELFNQLELEKNCVKYNLKDLSYFFEQINTNPLTLRQYREILEFYNSLEPAIMSFYEEFIESGTNIQLIDKVYKNSVHKAQIKLIEENFREDFKNYTPTQLNKLRTNLNQLDEEISKLYKRQIVSDIHNLEKKAPSGDNPTGKVRDKTEMELVRHIASRENPRISLRDYFNRAFHTITWLKPCTLMSPLSVSEVLPLVNTQYDVMIIDEASQMKPEFSIPSIVRAKQIVIVGDQKQLPPTDFFRSVSEDIDNEDEAEESILDMALTTLPPRTLLWHYRSKHEDLIKFSNAKFYNNELIIPSASDKNNKGIKSIYIEDGVYKSGAMGGFNDLEAKKVVSEIITFMRERPNESLGVATINKAQKDHIETLFDIERDKKNPSIDRYLKIWSQKDGGLNEFFIKNLENVQGDERDAIFISTVYGPDSVSGQVFQRFGPITGKYGHRRLNVLFTRAKNQIILFTSLKPSNIQVHENKSTGVRILHEYLVFAETGKLSLGGEPGTKEVESPFQQWAIDQINSFPGFSAEWEIGVKGYRIDIGVKHEDYRHGYIMAVETDGASYHSIKSARDRDKLRQEILESYGWKFHRIWSTDWLRDPVTVKEDLRIALDERLKKKCKIIEHPQLTKSIKKSHSG